MKTLIPTDKKIEALQKKVEAANRRYNELEASRQKKFQQGINGIDIDHEPSSKAFHKYDSLRKDLLVARCIRRMADNGMTLRAELVASRQKPATSPLPREQMAKQKFGAFALKQDHSTRGGGCISDSIDMIHIETLQPWSIRNCPENWQLIFQCRLPTWHYTDGRLVFIQHLGDTGAYKTRTNPDYLRSPENDKDLVELYEAVGLDPKTEIPTIWKRVESRRNPKH